MNNIKFVTALIILCSLSTTKLYAVKSLIASPSMNYTIGVWELLKSENGVNVYVSSYEGFDGALKLTLKFENTTANPITLSIEIGSKANPDFKHVQSVNIPANASVEIKDENNPIEIAVGQTEKDFTVKFN